MENVSHFYVMWPFINDFTLSKLPSGILERFLMCTQKEPLLSNYEEKPRFFCNYLPVKFVVFVWFLPTL